mmetsp:Transcript_37287/g.97769  ORF Transcript_37287/g.97769 Transcript_37287/m.97769 type:complete len:97 (-) Transcript_37287:297-587(-)
MVACGDGLVEQCVAEVNAQQSSAHSARLTLFTPAHIDPHVLERCHVHDAATRASSVALGPGLTDAGASTKTLGLGGCQFCYIATDESTQAAQQCDL